MVTLDELMEWKKHYDEIYQVEIHEQNYIFRALGREEYKQLVLMDLSLGENQEVICFSSVLYPQEYDFSSGIAGIAEVLADFVLDVSGLHTNQALELIGGFRQEMQNYDFQVDCIIHEAFPEFTLEDISTWSVRKTMKYLSRAEWILTSLKGVHLQHVYQQAADELAEYDEEEYEDQQVEEQEPQPEQPPKRNPFERELRPELVGHTEPPPKPVKQKVVAPEGAVQTEEELLAMLAGSGTAIVKPATDMNDVKPELNWFGYMDELKGDFD